MNESDKSKGHTHLRTKIINSQGIKWSGIRTFSRNIWKRYILTHENLKCENIRVMLKKLFLLLMGFIFIILGYRTPTEIKDGLLIPPPPHIEHFTLGFNEVLSDVFWIRVVQSLDYCETIGREKKLSKEMGDIVHQDTSLCHKGWVFHMLDAITDLTPRFRLPYVVGGTTLSVLVDDREGAKLIFDKGLRVFSEDWGLAYRAAYHYLYELKHPQRAAELLLIAHRNGGPEWLPLLASRLYSKSGRKVLGIIILQDLLEKGNLSERVKKRAEEKLKALMSL